MPNIKEQAEGIIEKNINNFWNSFWMVLMLVLGLGVTSMIDNRIQNHPDMIDIKKTLASDAVKIEQMSGTLIRLEVHMQNNGKTMDSILRSISKVNNASPSP